MVLERCTATHFVRTFDSVTWEETWDAETYTYWACSADATAPETFVPAETEVEGRGVVLV